MQNNSKQFTTMHRLQALDWNEIGQLAQVIVPIAEQAIPLVEGIITRIMTAVSGTGDIEYTVVINTGRQKLDDAAQKFVDTMNAINQERAAQGLPTFDVPDVEPPPGSGDQPAPAPAPAPSPDPNFVPPDGPTPDQPPAQAPKKAAGNKTSRAK